MPTTKRALIAPREDVVDKFGHLPGDRALPKGGGDPPKRSRRGKAGTAEASAGTAEASGGASISDAVHPAQSVAAGAGRDVESFACTYSYLDTSKVKLDNLRASVARQLRALGRTEAEIERFIAALGVPGARPPSSLEDTQLALKEVLKNAKELPFYAGKEHTATLTAGLHALREDKGTPILFCLKEPTAEGVGVAPDGSPTYTLEGCVEKISAAAAARGARPRRSWRSSKTATGRRERWAPRATSSARRCLLSARTRSISASATSSPT